MIYNDELEENGVPQTDVEVVDQPKSATGDENSSQTELHSEEAGVNTAELDDVPVLEQPSTRSPRKVKLPFTVRVKVASDCVVVTIKRDSNDDAIVHYLPIRW